MKINEENPQKSDLSKDDALLLQQWCLSLQKYLQACFERAVIIVSGEQSWCIEQMHVIAAVLNEDKTLLVSDQIDAAMPLRQARTQLGQEYHNIIFDATVNFDLDALGAVSGTLCGGGLLILLLAEPQSTSIDKNNLYLKMISALLRKDNAVYRIEKSLSLPLIKKYSEKFNNKMVNFPYLTSEQEKLVLDIEENILQNTSKVMVVIADRGRGKSSALGLVAGKLLKKGIKKIIVTAPRLSISATLFHHANSILNTTDKQRGKLFFKESSLEFVAPDDLLIKKPLAEVLIVDEAAAIPLSMLKKMLNQYAHVIFVSTVYGYEGTGRGFVLKFFNFMDESARNWQNLTMKMPVRWVENDPLEGWINKILCLHSELESVPEFKEIKHDDIQFELLDKHALIKDQKKCLALFALLVTAHYRTRPSDFQFLLNEPLVRIYVLSYQQQIIAVSVVNQEGGFNAELSTAIYRGKRRPEGNLLAQTLCFHAGCEQAAILQYARIMRVAVQPKLQNRGLGSRLIKYIVEKEKANVDMIGTSFSANAPLLKFWQALNFEAVRVGFSRDHVSGNHSVVMLEKNSLDVFKQLRTKFRLNIGYWLQDALQDIDDDLKDILLLDVIKNNGILNEDDWQDIKSFAYYSRGYEVCSCSLKKLVDTYTSELNILNKDLKDIIILRINLQKDWPAIVDELNLIGKKQAIKKLRKAIAQLLDVIRDLCTMSLTNKKI